MRQEKWLDKPYYSLDAYMKYTYGQKVYKIAVDAGLTCPNRDGTLGEHGCIFCSAGGSGDFAVPIAGGNRQDGQIVVGASANGCVYEHRSKRDSRGASTEVYHKEYERRGSCVDVERKRLISNGRLSGAWRSSIRRSERSSSFIFRHTRTPTEIRHTWNASGGKH